MQVSLTAKALATIAGWFFMPVFALTSAVSSGAGAPTALPLQNSSQHGAGAAALSCVTLHYGLSKGLRDNWTGGDVTELQDFLSADGYLPVAATGYFGSLTFAAVQKFQTSKGIPSTGFVGPLTRAAIQKVSCGTTPAPQPKTSVSIKSIAPSSGLVGTTVTLGGSGFTVAGNIVHFGGGALSNISASPAVFNCPNIPAGSTSNCAPYPQVLTFTVPSSISPYCAPGTACPMYMQLLAPGTYTVYVANENGSSNSVSFTITGANPIP